MKYLILDPETKRIIFISDTIRDNEIGGTILDPGINIAPGIAQIIEYQGELPEGIIPEKYLYKDGTFEINPLYVEP